MVVKGVEVGRGGSEVRALKTHDLPCDVPREPQGQKSPKKSSSRKVTQMPVSGKFPKLVKSRSASRFSSFPLQGNLLSDLLLTYFRNLPETDF